MKKALLFGTLYGFLVAGIAYVSLPQRPPSEGEPCACGCGQTYDSCSDVCGQENGFAPKPNCKLKKR